ncbi:hypothetical protein AB0H71_29720 [Nocardia sp. NPDC050697]|uniref:hypothetical protein n=1 Tax=Nocardia sp. NPDC050697 TaxID=3155158 RepID=UPI0033E0FE62
MDSGAAGLHWFEVFVPRYREWTGADPAGGGYEALAARYDQQRGTDVSGLRAFATALAGEVESGLAAELTTQGARAHELATGWHGSAASANASQLLTDVRARSTAGVETLREVSTAAATAVETIETAIGAKATAVRDGFTGETVAGASAAQVDRVLDRACGTGGGGDEELRAVLGEHGGGTDVAAGCRRWLDEVFAARVEERVAVFTALCADTDTTITGAYAQLLGVLERVEVASFTSPSGQPAAETDLTYTAVAQPLYQPSTALTTKEAAGQDASRPLLALGTEISDPATTPASTGTEAPAASDMPAADEVPLDGEELTVEIGTEAPAADAAPLDAAAAASASSESEDVQIPGAVPSSAVPGQWSATDTAAVITAASQITGTIPDLITAVGGLAGNLDEIITATGQAGAAVISAAGESAAAVIDATDNQPSAPIPGADIPADTGIDAPDGLPSAGDPELSPPGEAADPQTPVSVTGEDATPAGDPVEELDSTNSGDLPVNTRSSTSAPGPDSGVASSPATVAAGSPAVWPGPTGRTEAVERRPQSEVVANTQLQHQT